MNRLALGARVSIAAAGGGVRIGAVPEAWATGAAAAVLGDTAVKGGALCGAGSGRLQAPSRTAKTTACNGVMGRAGRFRAKGNGVRAKAGFDCRAPAQFIPTGL